MTSDECGGVQGSKNKNIDLQGTFTRADNSHSLAVRFNFSIQVASFIHSHAAPLVSHAELYQD